MIHLVKQLISRPLAPRQRELWARVRLLGRWRVALFYGVLCWGIVVGVPWAIGTELQAAGWSLAGISPARLVWRLVVGVLGFPIPGTGLGLALWWVYERRFAASIAASGGNNSASE